MEAESAKFKEKYSWDKLQILWHYLLISCVDFEAFRLLLTQPLLSPDLNEVTSHAKETVLDFYTRSMVNGRDLETIEKARRIIKFLIDNDGKYSWSVDNYTSLMAVAALSADYEILKLFLSKENLKNRYDINGNYILQQIAVILQCYNY